jgi:DNA polymerase-3 subunit beta
MVVTDLDTELLCEIDAKVVRMGTAVIRLITLDKIARLGKSANVVFNLPMTETASSKCLMSIATGSTIYRVPAMPPNEFPTFSVDVFGGKAILKLPSTTFNTMLSRVMFAMSDDDARYVLTGANFKNSSAGLEITATDGRQLSVINYDKITVNLMREGSFIVPGKALLAIKRGAQSCQGSVDLRFAATTPYGGRPSSTIDRASFYFDNVGTDKVPVSFGVSTRLIEGSFPNHNQVIPSESKIKVEFDRLRFLKVLQMASMMTSDRELGVRMELGFGIAQISSKSAEFGEFRETIHARNCKERMVVVFNPRFFIECLQTLTEPNVQLSFIDGHSPITLRSWESHHTYVVMPMRVNDEELKVSTDGG